MVEDTLTALTFAFTGLVGTGTSCLVDIKLAFHSLLSTRRTQGLKARLKPIPTDYIKSLPAHPLSTKQQGNKKVFRFCEDQGQGLRYWSPILFMQRNLYWLAHCSKMAMLLEDSISGDRRRSFAIAHFGGIGGQA